MTNSNKICRTVLDTQSVVKDQLNNILISELLSSGTINEVTYKNLTAQLASCIDKQTDALVDRILNEFRSNK